MLCFIVSFNIGFHQFFHAILQQLCLFLDRFCIHPASRFETERRCDDQVVAVILPRRPVLIDHDDRNIGYRCQHGHARMERKLLAVFPVTAFGIDDDMLTVLVEHFQRIVDPARVGMLPVNGDAARMAQQEAEAALLKTVLGGQGMDGKLIQGGIDDPAVDVTGVIGHDDGRFGEDLVLPVGIEIMDLRIEKDARQQGERRIEFSIGNHRSFSIPIRKDMNK